MRRINVKKIFGVIILGFVVLNLSWFSITTIKYKKYIKDIPKIKNSSYGIKKEDGYNYHVKKPDYLQYTGNLAVDNYEKGKLLIIWPLIFGGYEYGFRIQEEGGAYEIYVDENMNPIDKEDKIAIEKFQEHKTELEELFSKANEMWKLE